MKQTVLVEKFFVKDNLNPYKYKIIGFENIKHCKQLPHAYKNCNTYYYIGWIKGDVGQDILTVYHRAYSYIPESFKIGDIIDKCHIKLISKVLRLGSKNIKKINKKLEKINKSDKTKNYKGLIKITS